MIQSRMTTQCGVNNTIIERLQQRHEDHVITLALTPRPCREERHVVQQCMDVEQQ